MTRTAADQAARGSTKHAGGRKRTRTPDKYTPKQLKQIDEWAEAQAKDTTIASAMGINTETFREQFRERTEQKRAQGKLKVLEAQATGALARGKGAVTERIWYGKQHLEQTDRQDVTSGGREIAPVVHLSLVQDDKPNV